MPSRTRLAILISLIGVGLPWAVQADEAGPGGVDRRDVPGIATPDAGPVPMGAAEPARSRDVAPVVPVWSSVVHRRAASLGDADPSPDERPALDRGMFDDAIAAQPNIDEVAAGPATGGDGPARKPKRRRQPPALADAARSVLRRNGATTVSLVVPPSTGPRPGRDPRRPRAEAHRAGPSADAPRTVATIERDDDPLTALLQVLPTTAADAPLPYALLVLRSVEGRAALRGATVFQRLAREFVAVGAASAPDDRRMPDDEGRRGLDGATAAADLPMRPSTAGDDALPVVVADAAARVCLDACGYPDVALEADAAPATGGASPVAKSFPIATATIAAVDYDVFAPLAAMPGDASVTVAPTDTYDVFAPLPRTSVAPTGRRTMVLPRIDAPAVALRQAQMLDARFDVDIDPVASAAPSVDTRGASPVAAPSPASTMSAMLLARIDTPIVGVPSREPLGTRPASVDATLDRAVALIDAVRGRPLPADPAPAVPTLVASAADAGFAVSPLLARPDGIVVREAPPVQPLLPHGAFDVADAAMPRAAVLAHATFPRRSNGRSVDATAAMTSVSREVTAMFDIFDPRLAPSTDATASAARAIDSIADGAPSRPRRPAATVTDRPRDASAAATASTAAPLSDRAIVEPREHRLDPLGGALVAVGDDRLQSMRGGFETDGGLKISFGIERAVYVNGALVTTTALNIADLAKLTSAQAGRLDRGTLGVIQSGPNNTFAPGTIGANSVATVIQNTLNDQRIVGATQITATVNSLDLLRRTDLQSRIQSALTDSLRR